jgi:small GTP-binding protein
MPNYQAKVILVGSSGVGKSSLIGSFVGTEFEIGSSPTVAPAFCSLTVRLEHDVTVDLQCWDTAGQERFLSISTTYYRDADIALVCHAPGDATGIETWAKRVLDVTPSCKIFIVVTKSDSFEPDVLRNDEAATATMVAKYDAERFITSARTREGVNVLMEAVATAAIPAPNSTKVVEPIGTVVLNGKGSKKKKCC